MIESGPQTATLLTTMKGHALIYTGVQLHTAVYYNERTIVYIGRVKPDREILKRQKFRPPLSQILPLLFDSLKSRTDKAGGEASSRLLYCSKPVSRPRPSRCRKRLNSRAFVLTSKWLVTKRPYVGLTREQLGLTEKQAQTPIRVNGERWTLLEAARYLHDARRDSNPNRKKALGLAAELARLRREARDTGDTDLVGATDALEKSAREIWTADEQ